MEEFLMEKKVCIHFGEDITKSILFVLMLGLEISKSNSTTRVLSWCNCETGEGFSFQYPDISIHAICKDTTSFAHECIYCLLDLEVDGHIQEDNELSSPVTEIRFVPQNKEVLQEIYDAITECQSLHPDPDEEDDDFIDSESGFYYGDSEEIELSEQGQAVLDRLENRVIMPSQEEFVEMISTNGQPGVEAMEEGQFEDADNQEEHR